MSPSESMGGATNPGGRAGPRVALVAGVLVLTGLVVAFLSYSRVWRDNVAFEKAKRTEQRVADNYERALAAYQAYLAEHPAGRHARAARAKVERELPGLIDDREWRQAQAQDTLAAYQSYVGQFPNGKWQEQARRELQRKQAQAQREAEALRQAKEAQAQRQAEALQQAEKEARRQFAKGRKLYLYDPSPAVVSRSQTVCEVKYIRRPDAAVRGELSAYYVMKDGKSRAFPKGDPRELPEITEQRGTLSVSLFQEWDLENTDHVKLVFIEWWVEPGAMRVSELSNAVVVRCR